MDEQHYPASPREGLQRVRLSEWARQQGISRLTAYRMLKRGILPVPSERSPTGRWYVLVPLRQIGRTAIYARAAPSPRQIDIINNQIAALSEWTAIRHRSVFTVVREIADPFISPMPRLERLLADRQITEIVVDNPAIIGINRFQLLVAALAPQGRIVTAVHAGKQRDDGYQTDLHAAIISLCKLVHGPEKGPKAARQAFAYSDDG